MSNGRMGSYAEKPAGFGEGASNYLNEQFDRMKIPEDQREVMRGNIYDYSRKSRFIESSDNPMAEPSTSTAKGYYQFLDGSVGTAFNRFRNTTRNEEGNKPGSAWIEGDEGWGGYSQNPQEWSEDESDTMFLANTFGQGDSDEYMKAIGGGDRDAMKGAYSRYHHTNPDEATTNRMEQYF